MNSPLSVNVELVNNKVKFIGNCNRSRDTAIPMDFIPPLGDSEGYLGLELLVISFCGCVSTAVVALLRRTGRQISSYQMRAYGNRTTHPISLKSIDAEIMLKSPDVTKQDMDGILKEAATISPVWIAVRNNVEVNLVYKITTGALAEV